MSNEKSSLNGEETVSGFPAAAWDRDASEIGGDGSSLPEARTAPPEYDEDDPLGYAMDAPPEYEADADDTLSPAYETDGDDAQLESDTDGDSAPPESEPDENGVQPEVTAEAAVTAEESYLSRFWRCCKKYSWMLLLAAAVILVGYYTLLPSRGYFHSDTTDTLMWAVASRESGTLFNPDFNYACLLPFGTSMIMWALIPIFGITMKTHVISMFLFFLLFTGSMIWMLRKMKWSWGWVSVAVFVELMICSGSEKLREIFWGHTIYYSLAVLCLFVGLALLFTNMDRFEQLDAASGAEKRKRAMVWVLVSMLLIAVWFIVTGMNQIISIATISLPMMGALFCERWLDRDTKLVSQKNLRAAVIFFIMAVGMVLGFLITKAAAKGIVAGYEGAFSNYSPMEEWADHLINFPRAWFTLLGADMRDGDPLMSVASVGDLLIVITGIVLLVTPVMALCCYKKMEDARARLLVLTYWILFTLIMMGYIMGRLSSANWRLSPIVAMSAVVTVVFFRWASGQINMQRVMSLLMIPVVAVCAVTMVTIAKMPADNTEQNHLYRLAKGLEEHGLDYGYATFWNANGLTVASDSRVKCRSVNIDDMGYYPYYYQGCKGWYDAQPGQQKYFLLMTQGERDILEGNNLQNIKIEEFEIDGYIVWVFGNNLF